MASFRFDKETGKVIPVAEWYEKYGVTVGNSAVVLKSFEAFKSPLDGRMISDRRQLAEHNKKHGVTNIADYGVKHFEDAGKRMNNERIGNTAEANTERREIITQELHKRGMI